ncbi:MAG: redox-regulated ATPase YchF [Candidatus Acetothermia bacterium]
MGFSCGFLGLPNVGKSTIFNALSAAGAAVENYPFCTTQAQIGTVSVPDSALDQLADLFPEKEKVNTKLEFIDIAGLVEGAHQGEGLGNQFLSDIRGVDALLHVVRCFEDPDVAAAQGGVDPRGDVGVIQTELMLKDLETVEKRLDKADPNDPLQPLFLKLKRELESGTPLRQVDLTQQEKQELKGISPLTLKPVLYVANVSEDSSPECPREVEKIAQENQAPYLKIHGEIEAEVAELVEEEEQSQAYLEAWGVEESSLSRMIKAGYRLLNLVTYYTIEGPEVRAWTISCGSTALDAAGQIHSDFADHFVHCKVIEVDDLISAGSIKKAQEQGLLRRKGEDYEVQDGDVLRIVSAA